MNHRFAARVANLLKYKLASERLTLKQVLSQVAAWYYFGAFKLVQRCAINSVRQCKQMNANWENHCRQANIEVACQCMCKNDAMLASVIWHARHTHGNQFEAIKEKDGVKMYTVHARNPGQRWSQLANRNWHRSGLQYTVHSAKQSLNWCLCALHSYEILQSFLLARQTLPLCG